MRSYKQKELLGVIQSQFQCSHLSFKGRFFCHVFKGLQNFIITHKAFPNYPLFTYANRKETWMTGKKTVLKSSSDHRKQHLGLSGKSHRDSFSLIHAVNSSQTCEELHTFPNYHFNSPNRLELTTIHSTLHRV